MTQTLRPYAVKFRKCGCGSSEEETAIYSCQQVCLREVRKHPRQLYLRRAEASSVALMSFPIMFTDSASLSFSAELLLIGEVTVELSVNNLSPSRWGMVSVSFKWESHFKLYPLGCFLPSFLVTAQASFSWRCIRGQPEIRDSCSPVLCYPRPREVLTDLFSLSSDLALHFIPDAILLRTSSSPSLFPWLLRWFAVWFCFVPFDSYNFQKNMLLPPWSCLTCV